MVPRGLEAFFDDIALLCATVRKPSTYSMPLAWSILIAQAIHTERKYGDLQASRPKVSEDHVLGVIFRFDSHTDNLYVYEELTVCGDSV